MLEQYRREILELMIEEIDQDLSETVIKAIDVIQNYQRPHNKFCEENFRVFLALEVCQDSRAAMKILTSTSGNNTFNECNRLLLMNQFKRVYTILQEQLDDDDCLDQKAVAAHYFLGMNQYNDQQFQQAFSERIFQLLYYKDFDEGQLDQENPYHLKIRYLEQCFQSRLAESNDFKILYIQKFRSQTYDFYFGQDLNLNQLLIEMNPSQICKIMLLPTDYFNSYYNAFIATINILCKQSFQVNNLYESFINKYKINSYEVRYVDFELFMNAIHTGITRSIVNKKIRFNNSEISQNIEISTGCFDACLVLRQLQKNRQDDPVDDIIYETLIYKLT